MFFLIFKSMFLTSMVRLTQMVRRSRKGKGKGKGRQFV